MKLLSHVHHFRPILWLTLLVTSQSFANETDVVFETVFGDTQGIAVLSEGRVFDGKRIKRQYPIITLRDFEGHLKPMFGDHGHLFLMAEDYQTVSVRTLAIKDSEMVILGERFWFDANDANEAVWARKKYSRHQAATTLEISEQLGIPLDSAKRLSEAQDKNHSFLMRIDLGTGATKSFVLLKDLKPPITSRTDVRFFVGDDANPTNILPGDDGSVLVTVDYNGLSDETVTGLHRILPDGSFDPKFGHEGLLLLPGITHSTDLVRSSSNGDIFVSGFNAQQDINVVRILGGNTQIRPELFFRSRLRTSFNSVRYDVASDEVIAHDVSGNRTLVANVASRKKKYWSLDIYVSRIGAGLVRLGDDVLVHGSNPLRQHYGNLVLVDVSTTQRPDVRNSIEIGRRQDPRFCSDIFTPFKNAYSLFGESDRND